MDDWVVVETAQDFRTFLSVLSYDFVRSSEQWRNRQLPDYLHAWARWLYASYLEPGSPDCHQIDPPTWRGFAFQLQQARTRDGPPLRRRLPTVTSWRQVTTAENFVVFLGWLGDEFRRDQAELATRAAQGLWAAELAWTSEDLGSYLDTWVVWSAWAFADGPPPSPVGSSPAPQPEGVEPLSWRSCAGQLFAASRYE
ncbi:MAG TPA: hypothetical protein VGC06_07610 [Actinomycetes bacterium]